MADALDLKVFVPSRDFEESKAFYSEPGFRCNWETERLAELQIEYFRFLLQNFFNEQLMSNFMLQLMVSDADKWWQRICDSKGVDTYDRAKATEPEIQPWGAACSIPMGFQRWVVAYCRPNRTGRLT